MHRYSRRLLQAAAMMAAVSVFAPDASAVPAKPGLVERRQEDGSTLLVQLRGDEFSHFILSEDGYPLVEEGGLLYFAQTGDAGPLKASSFRAVAPASRDKATQAFLSTLDRDAMVKKAASRAADSRQRAMQKGPGLCTTTFPGKGDQKVLVILVSYSDLDFSTENAHDYFTGLLNEPGFSEWKATGSAREYFLESSNGQFRPEFDVYGPVKLPQRMSYYGGNDAGGNDRHPEMMAVHACQALDDEVDFSQYDRDGDGLIDNAFIFYAGQGEANGGSASTVWPHSWDVRYGQNDSPYVFDGVTLGHYACTNEWLGNRPDGVGTFIHEFSHVMGLPDLYATKYTSSFTPGAWSVLDYGPYNNDGRTPPLYSAFERYAMDWMTPEPISGAANIALPAIDSNRAFIITTPKDNEYFLLENRQQAGWDKYIPGHGMLVWHVDFQKSIWDRNQVNNTPAHQYVDIEEADNRRDDYSRAGDAFPGTAGITSFTDDTAPSMKTWAGQKIGLPLTDIAEENGIVTFKVAGGLEISEATEALEPEEGKVASDGFTARWKAVADADHYELNVYRASDPSKAVALMKAPSAAWADAGTATEYRVEGLEPSTDYAYVVFAAQKDKGLSPASNEVRVRTLAAPLGSRRPVALEATEVSGAAFTANWEALEGADDYLVNVCSLTPEKYDKQVVDFANATMPSGWSSSSKLTYSDPEMCGDSAPSLRLTADEAYVRSPEYRSGIAGFSFWQRAVADAEGNELRVDWFVDGEWLEGDSIPVVTAAGGAVQEFAEVPFGTKAVRIVYLQDATRRYSVAIDDIAVTTVSEFAQTPLPLFTDRLAGGQTSMRVEGLEKNSVYGYTVVAVSGEERSLPSEMMVVNTSGDCSGIEGIAADGRIVERTECYTLSGVRIAAPVKGEPCLVKIFYTDGTVGVHKAMTAD